MTNVLEFAQLHETRSAGFRWVDALEGLHACFLVRADDVDALLGELGCVSIDVADRSRIFGELLAILELVLGG